MSDTIKSTVQPAPTQQPTPGGGTGSSTSEDYETLIALIDSSLNVRAELFPVDEAEWSNGTNPVAETRTSDETKADKDATEANKAESGTWSKTGNTLKDRTDERIKRWDDEITEYLTFAGLFTAILTGFNLQSYSLLQPGTSDQTNAILMQMSVQLEAFRVNTNFVNSTSSALRVSSGDLFQVPLYAIWLNALWFVSLIFSLASATIGIIAKQWLKEYDSGLKSGSSQDVTRRRQYRYDNLQKWHVPTMIALVPVLLIIAVVLFVAGLLILLYNVHRIVAIITSAFAGLLLLFIFATTALPTFFNSCCYYSQQAYTFRFVVEGLSISASMILPLALSLPLLLPLIAITLSITLGVVYPLVILAPVAILASLLLGQFCNAPFVEPFWSYAASLVRKAQQKFMERPPWLLPSDSRSNNDIWTVIQRILIPPQVWKRGEDATMLGTHPDKLDVNVAITTFAALLDDQTLSDATNALVEKKNHYLWNYYVSKTNITLNNYRLSMEWQASLKQIYWKAANHASWLFVRSIIHPPKHQEVDDNSLPYKKEAKTLSSLRGVSDPERLRLRALGSMRRTEDTGSADQHWLAIYHHASSIASVLQVGTKDINSSTYKIIIAAAAYRLHDLKNEKAFRPRWAVDVVRWKLSFIRQHIVVLCALLHRFSQQDEQSCPILFPASESSFKNKDGDRARIALGGLVTHAFDSIQNDLLPKILDGVPQKMPSNGAIAHFHGILVAIKDFAFEHNADFNDRKDQSSASVSSYFPGIWVVIKYLISGADDSENIVSSRPKPIARNIVTTQFLQALNGAFKDLTRTYPGEEDGCGGKRKRADLKMKCSIILDYLSIHFDNAGSVAPNIGPSS